MIWHSIQCPDGSSNSSIDRMHLNFCKTKHEISRVIEESKVPVIGSFDFLKKELLLNKNWSITSDSIALLISEELQLNTLLIVKYVCVPL